MTKELVNEYRTGYGDISKAIQYLEVQVESLRELMEYRAHVIEEFDNPNQAVAVEHKAIARRIRRDLEDWDEASA